MVVPFAGGLICEKWLISYGLKLYECVNVSLRQAGVITGVLNQDVRPELIQCGPTGFGLEQRADAVITSACEGVVLAKALRSAKPAKIFS
jgi:hypothetical protein